MVIIVVYEGCMRIMIIEKVILGNSFMHNIGPEKEKGWGGLKWQQNNRIPEAKNNKSTSKQGRGKKKNREFQFTDVFKILTKHNIWQ